MRDALALYACEFAGTALLLAGGATAVALIWAADSPVLIVEHALFRRALTGLLFALSLVAVVYSPLGQRSGAHLNPAVTLAFWRLGKIPGRHVAPYVLAQVLGAVAGVALAFALTGDLLRSVQFAATVPGPGWTWPVVLLAELACTFALVLLILVCVDKPSLAPFTGVLAGALLVLLVAVEAPVSGTGINPARSVAPALFVPLVRGQWLYVIGPLAGGMLAAVVYGRGWRGSPVCAKLYHTPAYPCAFHRCEYRLLRPGELLMREGERGDEAYLLERGSLTVTRDGMMLAELKKGDWVGEMSLLLDEPRSATVVAAGDAQLRRFTRESFRRLIAEDPARAEELLRQLAHRLRQANSRVAAGG